MDSTRYPTGRTDVTKKQAAPNENVPTLETTVTTDIRFGRALKTRWRYGYMKKKHEKNSSLTNDRSTVTRDEQNY